MAKYNAKSPTLFIKTALIADLLASGLKYQKFINKYEANPIPSHPKKNCIKFDDSTIISIKKVKIFI